MHVLSLTASTLALLAFHAAACAGIGADTLPTGTDYSVVHSFLRHADGNHPAGGVLALQDGSLLGVTPAGGKHGGDGHGTIYRIGQDGQETIAHDFVGATDGASPSRHLMLASDGRVYGVAPAGGPMRKGTVFRIDADGGNFTVVHAFGCCPGAPRSPSSPLFEGRDGNFYGTSRRPGAGTIFRMTPSGEVTVLHSFAQDGGEGRTPDALIQAVDGDFYGTALGGGIVIGGFGGGVVFRLREDGTFTVLHRFDRVTEGEGPFGDIAQGLDGAIYGALDYEQENRRGRIYKIGTDGALSFVHDFRSTASRPRGIMRAPDGNFYGTTLLGGEKGYGTAYKMTPDGTVTILHRFRLTDGQFPQNDALALGPDGYLYGTCNVGGSDDLGTVFKLLPDKAARAEP